MDKIMSDLQVAEGCLSRIIAWYLEADDTGYRFDVAREAARRARMEVIDLQNEIEINNPHFTFNMEVNDGK